MVRLPRGGQRERARRDSCGSSWTSSTQRNDFDFHRGTFRVRGDVVDIFPAYEEKQAFRIEFFGDEIERIHEIDPLTGARLRRLRPRAHLSRPATTSRRRHELEARHRDHRGGAGASASASCARQNKLLEAQRLEQRTRYDLEMLQEIGLCTGHRELLAPPRRARSPGEPPYTLLDYFPEDFLLFVDESHVTLPQIARRCTTATARARRRWSSTASACPARSTTGR